MRLSPFLWILYRYSCVNVTAIAPAIIRECSAAAIAYCNSNELMDLTAAAVAVDFNTLERKT